MTAAARAVVRVGAAREVGSAEEREAVRAGGGDEGGEGSGEGGDTRMRIPRLALRAVREDEEEGEGLTG